MSKECCVARCVPTSSNLCDSSDSGAERVHPSYRGSESPHWVLSSVNRDKDHKSQPWLAASDSYMTTLLTAVVTATLQSLRSSVFNFEYFARFEHLKKESFSVLSPSSITPGFCRLKVICSRNKGSSHRICLQTYVLTPFKKKF